MRLYRLCFYDGLTRVSKVLLICSALIFLFSYRINSDLLLTTAAVSMTLLAWSLALGYLYRPRMNLGRQTPEVAVAGQPLHSRMLISNTGPRSLYNFTVREMGGFITGGMDYRDYIRKDGMLLPTLVIGTAEPGGAQNGHAIRVQQWHDVAHPVDAADEQ